MPHVILKNVDSFLTEKTSSASTESPPPLTFESASGSTSTIMSKMPIENHGSPLERLIQLFSKNHYGVIINTSIKASSLLAQAKKISETVSAKSDASLTEESLILEHDDKEIAYKFDETSKTYTVDFNKITSLLAWLTVGFDKASFTDDIEASHTYPIELAKDLASLSAMLKKHSSPYSLASLSLGSEDWSIPSVADNSTLSTDQGELTEPQSQSLQLLSNNGGQTP